MARPIKMKKGTNVFSWKRIIIVLSIITTIVVFIVLLGPKFVLLYVLKSNYASKKAMYRTPVVRKIKQLDKPMGATVKFDFENLSIVVEDKNGIENIFGKCCMVVRYNESYKGFLLEKDTLILAIREELKSGDRDSLESFFKNQFEFINYALVESSLLTTPDDVGVFSSAETIAETIYKLILKSVVIKPETDVYSFKIKEISGFQYGDPKKKDHIRIDFFDNKSNPFSMIFVSHSQDEIDTILSSIHGS